MEDTPTTFQDIEREFGPRVTQFYNRIRIGKVNVTNGVAEVLAMETMSAMPIEDKVAMSLVVLSRQGITGIRSGDNIIQIDKSK